MKTDDIAAVCCYFNFCNYSKILNNYHTFYKNIPHGLKLITVELSFKDQKPQITSPNTIHVHTNSIMWQKERLLTIGINKLLDEGYEKILWIDADTVYSKDNWHINISKALNDYIVVQGFSDMEERFTDKIIAAHGAMYRTFATQRYSGLASGGIWAARAELLKKHGLYQYAIVGGGDTIYLHGCIPSSVCLKYPDGLMPRTKYFHSEKLFNDYQNWIIQMRASVQDNAYFVQQKAIFLPHGAAVNRCYEERHSMLKNFDKDLDITTNKDGVFEWSSNKPEMHDAITKYFYRRNDDCINNPQVIITEIKKNMTTKILGLSGRKQSGKNTSANFLAGLEMVSNGLISWMKINPQGQLVVPAKYGDKIEERVFDISNPSTFDFQRENVWPYVKLYSYADKLKQFCVEVLGLTREQCYGTDEQKNSITSLRWENMPGIITHEKLFEALVKHMHTKIKNPLYEDANFVLTYHESGQMTAREVMQYFGTNVCRKMYSNVWVNALLKQISIDKPAFAIVTDVRFPNEVEGIQNIGGKVIRFLRAPFIQDEHTSEKALDKFTNFDYVCDNTNMNISQQNESVYNKLVEWKYIENDNQSS